GQPRAGALLARRRAEPGVETLMDGPWRARRMCIDGEELGVAVWRIGETAAHELDQVDRLADILADLGAAATARARLSAHKAAADALVSTEKLRTALLSSISHDLRTPLAAILASSSSLKDYDAQFSPETRRDLAANIQEEAERLNRYVTNLLSMTRLESGALDMELHAISAFEVAAAAAQRVERRKGARRLLLSGPERPLFVRADPVLLEQALANVVENAIAYSPDGTDVELRVTERDGGVEIEVVDAGPGVPEAEIGKIFDKFYRSAGTRQIAEGAGMGLPIARGFVEAVGGAMTARARPDGASGLSVLVTLPEAKA
ncbi:ATP-binding protein, partial [Caulobacter sp. 17J65-9]|uniref:sensor histidine kinase n=1 Tax=Caulobacter sp. 17J65-9 TaxID=2709382 RepID=UPI0013C7D213